jgi:hypothetical protein
MASNWDPKETLPEQGGNKGFIYRGPFAEARPNYSNLFPNNSKFEKIDPTPNFCTEVRSGIQLSRIADSTK